MSKAILISIKPEWCELIESGKKTIEVRKTRPKLKTPFKCYIYCTKGNVDSSFYCGLDGIKNGKVIGEFVCKGFETLDEKALLDGMDEINVSRIEHYSCVSIDELLSYKGNKPFVYGWHISDLVIYDKPRELKEFYRECDGVDNVGLCYECDKSIGEEFDCCLHYELHLTRPPQSWCYVEKMKARKNDAE